jgi:putative DNA primase/helicase
MVPFEVFIPPEERERGLKERLVKEEGPGILSWCVRGCMEWQRIGLAEPDSVKAVTAQYRAESDVIGGWIAERCDDFREHEFLRDQARTAATVLYGDFARWAKTAGLDPMPGPKFGNELEQRGFRRKPSNGKHYRHGISLKPEPQPEDAKDDSNIWEMPVT